MPDVHPRVASYNRCGSEGQSGIAALKLFRDFQRATKDCAVSLLHEGSNVCQLEQERLQQERLVRIAYKLRCCMVDRVNGGRECLYAIAA